MMMEEPMATLRGRLGHALTNMRNKGATDMHEH